MLQPATIYLNGQFMSNDRASISPDDRGFYFADGVYEVIKYYKNGFFCFDEHMNRLRNSLAEVHIDYREIGKLDGICMALIGANEFKGKYAGVYIQITRGVAPRVHRFPGNDVRPTIYIRAFPLPGYLQEMINGVTIMSREDIRWLRCNIKSIGLLPNTLLFEEVANLGAFECMLVRNGYITEATHSNLLAVRHDTVYSHPESNLILPGITKAAVLDLCRQNNLRVIEEPIRFSEINDFNEWFLTGTGSEIIPVVKINSQTIGNGKPGVVTRALQKSFMKITYEKIAGEIIEFPEK